MQSKETRSSLRDDVARAFIGIDGWISDNGWAGYDPYDVRGQDWFVRLFGAQNIVFRKIRGLLAVIEKRVPPLWLRKALRVRREINPKGMGLLAMAYLTRYESTGDTEWLSRAEEVLDWLFENACRDYPGVSWGYPFHWQSRIFLPRGTPAVVVTGTIGDAWIRHYELTESPRSLSVIQGISEFFVKGLNRPVEEADVLCFSYTPLDDFKVHNASLFAAAFLARSGQLTDNPEHTDLALRAARYTISEQNPDGSFYYWGSEPPTIIDHYHTGFVLRLLTTIHRCTAAEFVDHSVERGYRFYLERLFRADSVPKFTPELEYPIDIHSCSEALLCILELGSKFGGTEKIEPVFRFIQDSMLSDEGWYIAEIRLHDGRERRIEIPFMRWGQAWMLLALAKLQHAIDSGAIQSGDAG